MARKPTAVIDVGSNSVKLHVGERSADGSWRTIAAAPAASNRRAVSSGSDVPGVSPRRILTVTGTSTARTIASTILAAAKEVFLADKRALVALPGYGRSLDLGVSLDGRFGGEIFSMTNMHGRRSGVVHVSSYDAAG